MVYRLNLDAQVRAELYSVMGFIDSEPRSPHGGFIEGIPATTPRRQNPQMHLFEAMIAAFDATSDSDFQNRAGDLCGPFVASLFDPQRQVLGEYFKEDCSRIELVQVEPGLHAEWLRLLKGFERITSCPTARHRSPRSLRRCLSRRCDGLPGDGDDAGDNIRKVTPRCWLQSEIAKAWIAQAEAGEQDATEQDREALLGCSGTTYVIPCKDGFSAWRQQCKKEAEEQPLGGHRAIGQIVYRPISTVIVFGPTILWDIRVEIFRVWQANLLSKSHHGELQR
jgi:mannose/cellobiose epimerase-like protein (N-acyl-D-glucosamine 2-epimerase family)